jgi:hypothetical protein
MKKTRKLIFRIEEDHQHLDLIRKLLDEPYPTPFVSELERELLKDWCSKQGEDSQK